MPPPELGDEGSTYHRPRFVRGNTRQLSPAQQNLELTAAEWVVEVDQKPLRREIQDILKAAVVVKLDGPIECLIRVGFLGNIGFACPSSMADPLLIVPGKITQPIDFAELTEDDWMSLVSTEQGTDQKVSSISACFETFR